MKGGLGTAAVHLPDGAMVAALVAVNPLGDVVDPESGRVLAGVRTEDGKGLRGGMDILLRGGPDPRHRGENSVISVVATNVALSKAEATRVARMAHNGVARTVRPVFTPWDGDTLFALSTGEKTVAQPTLVAGAVAAEAVARAVVRAVQMATGLPGLPSARELGRA
jgi:L-aminopeptidase/D-esterase-like protein